MGLVIHCADVGSVSKGNFGWARLAADETVVTTGIAIEQFAEQIAMDLNAGFAVALGFECPLFVPVPEDPSRLTSARPGERDRAWSAGAGSGSLATGLTETVWILDQVKQRTISPHAVFVDWKRFQEALNGMFIWEAFVSKEAKSQTHHGDAELAVRCFQANLGELENRNAIVCDGRVRSLFGAALLQTGWAEKLNWLHTPCLVLRVQPSDKVAYTS